MHSSLINLPLQVLVPKYAIMPCNFLGAQSTTVQTFDRHCTLAIERVLGAFQAQSIFGESLKFSLPDALNPSEMAGISTRPPLYNDRTFSHLIFLICRKDDFQFIYFLFHIFTTHGSVGSPISRCMRGRPWAWGRLWGSLLSLRTGRV